MTLHIPTALLAGRRSTAAAAQGGLATARPYATAAAAVAGVLALSALANHLLAKRAERRNPPSGHFIDVDGVRLHYLERGEGPPLVLLHGNGTMIEDFDSSGLIDLAARRHRVIVFDRPGFGHSTRPRETLWTADEQAGLFRAALARLGVSRALVLGHSWGASVAVALALKHPQSVSGLVLASGYYYPSARVDFAIMSGPAVPLIGTLVRYTLAPIVSRLMWPLLLRKIFGPAPVPTKFKRFPKEMAVRPTQIRAAAAESGLPGPDNPNHFQRVPEAEDADGCPRRCRRPADRYQGTIRPASPQHQPQHLPPHRGQRPHDSPDQPGGRHGGDRRGGPAGGPVAGHQAGATLGARA
jgi:pimeloyl-ACP methyl ester carboxylesterase